MTEQVFPQTAAEKIMFEDGIGCQYNNTAVQAKLHQIAAALAPLVKHLDFAAPDCLEVASSRNYQTLVQLIFGIPGAEGMHTCSQILFRHR